MKSSFAEDRPVARPESGTWGQQNTHEVDGSMETQEHGEEEDGAQADEEKGEGRAEGQRSAGGYSRGRMP